MVETKTGLGGRNGRTVVMGLRRVKRLRGTLKERIAKVFGMKMVDTSVRYYPVVEILKKKKLVGERILEVGSGARGLTEFLPVKITGVDVAFGGESPLVEQVRCSAAKLPFKDSSFEVVVSVDTLEHLAAGDRVKATREMLRVAKKWVIIHIPCDKEALAQDRDLWLTHRRLFHGDHPALGEHLQYGVPETTKMVEWLTESSEELNKKIGVKVRPTLNLNVRKYLMRSWITESVFLHVMDRTINILMIPFLAKLNFGKCYRRLFVVKII